MLLTYADPSGVAQQSVLSVDESAAVKIFSTAATPDAIEQLRGKPVLEIDWETWGAQLQEAGIVTQSICPAPEKSEDS